MKQKKFLPFKLNDTFRVLTTLRKLRVIGIFTDCTKQLVTCEDMNSPSSLRAQFIRFEDGLVSKIYNYRVYQ
jgi:hypothetical protein